MSEEKTQAIQDAKKNFFSTIFKKIKKIKHLDIILTILFIAIILLIYFSTFSNSFLSSSNGTEQIKSDSLQNNSSVISGKDDLMAEYTKEVELKLANVVSSLKNAGNVSVAVKFSKDIEYVYAYSTKVEELENGTRVETRTPIFNTENNVSVPILLQTKMPEIESVVIISSGAKNTEVKLDILRVVQLLYNIPSSKVEVFVGN